MEQYNNPELIKAIASNYSSFHRRISPHMTMFERTHLWPPNSREVDVFGHCWSLAWINFSDGQVALHRLGEKIKLDGPFALFIPPFSILDFEFAGGEITWEAVVSDLPLDAWAPNQATIYRRPNHLPIPQSLEEIKDFILEHKKTGAKNYIVEKIEIPSAIAEKFKNYLNENFEEEMTISEISSKLGYNHAVLDRAFKKAYGISPINYRNKMRVLDAIHKLVLGKLTVTDVGYDVGFSTSGNFSKQFKKIMKLPPSEFSN